MPLRLVNSEEFESEEYFTCNEFYLKNVLLQDFVTKSVVVPASIKKLIVCTLGNLWRTLFESSKSVSQGQENPTTKVYSFPNMT